MERIPHIRELLGWCCGLERSRITARIPGPVGKVFLYKYEPILTLKSPSSDNPTTLTTSLPHLNLFKAYQLYQVLSIYNNVPLFHRTLHRLRHLQHQCHSLPVSCSL